MEILYAVIGLLVGLIGGFFGAKSVLRKLSQMRKVMQKVINVKKYLRPKNTGFRKNQSLSLKQVSEKHKSKVVKLP